MKWDSFEGHLLASQKELHFTKQFSDVTLVSDDLVEFLAHKTILARASPMLKTLLAMSSQQQSSFLYLKGVKQQDLEAILQYIYLGETELSEHRVQEFREIAQDLGIQDMVNEGAGYNYKLKVEKLDFLSSFFPKENHKVESSSEDNGFRTNLGFLNDVSPKLNNQETPASYYEETLENHQESLLETSYSEEITDKMPIISEETIGSEEYKDEDVSSEQLENNEIAPTVKQDDTDTMVKSKGRERKQQPAKPRAKEEPADCDICNTHYTTKRSYRRHYMSVHELKMFNCNECEETFNYRDSLTIHITKVHRKISLPCTKCERVFRCKSDLRAHVLAKHSITCDYHKKRFLTNEELQEHIQEEHVKKYCT